MRSGAGDGAADVMVNIRLSSVGLQCLFQFFEHLAGKEADSLERMIVAGDVPGKEWEAGPQQDAPIRCKNQPIRHFILHLEQLKTGLDEETWFIESRTSVINERQGRGDAFTLN